MQAVPTADAKATQSPRDRSSPLPVPSQAQVGALFRQAMSEETRNAAVNAFVAAQSTLPDDCLFGLLNDLPAQVDLTPLCAKLADALAAKPVAAPRTWQALLQSLQR